MTTARSTLRHPHARSTLRPGPAPKSAAIPDYMGLTWQWFTSHYSTQDAL